MGCGSSQAADGLVASNSPLDDKIQQLLMQEVKQENQVVKIVLLGAGECGKSTVLKQMKLMHGGFGEETELYIDLCHKNTLTAMATLCQACLEIKKYLTADQLKAAENVIQAQSDWTYDITVIRKEILTLLPSEEIQAVLKGDLADEELDKLKKSGFHMLDSAGYFLREANVNRICVPQFKVTDEDVLRSRLTTTGIVKFNFEVEHLKFRIFDVGGQRGERSKWIHCFDDVTAIMFVTSLSEYDQNLAEDQTKNRMDESLDLFDSIINLSWFEEASIILFLNKKDIFEEKVKKIDIGITFSDYTGGLDYDNGLEFIKNEYLDVQEEKQKTVYPHVTDATDTDGIKFVWSAVKQMILHNLMTGHGQGNAGLKIF